MADTIRFRRNIAGSLTSTVLKLGEPSYDHDEGVVRVGDGKTVYTELPAFVTDTIVADMIAEASLGDGGGAAIAALIAELADDDHPDGFVGGQSFELIYENRKV